MREKKDQGLFSPTAPAFLCQRTAIHDFGFADDLGNAGKKAVCSAVGRGIPLPYPRRGKISPSSRLGFFLSYR